MLVMDITCTCRFSLAIATRLAQQFACIHLYQPHRRRFDMAPGHPFTDILI